MEPIIFIVWTCAVIFAATGIITLLALTKVITIETRFLNKLFTALILEVIAVTVGFGYTGYIKGDNGKSATKGIEVSSVVHFVDGENNRIANVSEKDFREKLEIKTTPDHNIKTLNGISFMVYGKESLPKITYTFRGYESRMIDLNKFKDSIQDNKINVGTVRLKQVKQDYNPENFESGDPNTLPDFFEGPPITTGNDGS
ncbi:MAG: hypothetical protein HKN48_07455 [Flavobacteriaceae bacterium]|nr:hypothetical protein [Flavobacteriaceae bacterium]